MEQVRASGRAHKAARLPGAASFPTQKKMCRFISSLGGRWQALGAVLPDTAWGLGRRKQLSLGRRMRRSARRRQSPAGVLQGLLSRGFPCPPRSAAGRQRKGLPRAVLQQRVSTQGQSIDKLKKGKKGGGKKNIKGGWGRGGKETHHLSDEEAPTPGTAKL